MTIEVIRLVSYITSVLVCAALAVSFLRKFLNKRLRVSLWWGTGFSLLACGILTMTVGAVYGFHKILGMLTFAFVAASVAFLYYAASLLFFDRKSFFREKFTVILFVTSLALFVLPLYFFEQYTATIIKSPAMILFAVAFLVLAVLFNQVVKRLSMEYCMGLGVLHSLAWWIAAVWSLYIALFWRSIAVVGIVFVLSSFEFMLLLYGCKGGDNMDEDNEMLELYVQMVNSVEDKIKREADAAKERLDNIMHKIGDTLIMMRVLEEKSFAKEEIAAHTSRIGIEKENLVDRVAEFVGTILRREGLERKKMVALAHETGIDENLVDRAIELAEDVLRRADFTKKKMVTRTSQIGIEKENLIERVVELVEADLALVRRVYSGPFPLKTDGGTVEYCQIDEIPYGETSEQAQKTTNSTGEHEMRLLAILARTRRSTDRDMIVNCCGLVIDMCTLENAAVTEYVWDRLEETVHPGGMIGHTYNILYAIDVRYGTKYAQLFRRQFQNDADSLFNDAKKLRTDAHNLINDLPTTPTPPSEQQAQEAAGYLKDTLDMLKKASTLLSKASEFVSD